MAKFRPVETILLVLIVAFTAANIGTEARYLLKRQQTCSDLSLSDCNGQKGTYLFGSFRNLTMKFFCDCINIFFILLAFITVNFIKQEHTQKVSRIVFLIILTLSLMSLGCGIKSVDQEDNYNQYNFNDNLTTLCTAQDTYNTKLAAYNTMLAYYNKIDPPTRAALQAQYAKGDYSTYVQSKGYIDLVAFNPSTSDATKLQNAQGAVLAIEGQTGLPTAKAALDAAVSQVTYANYACPIVTDFKNIYLNYRNSVDALVILNFVWTFTLFLQGVFRWSDEEEENNRVKILSGTNIKLQEYKSNDALKAHHTDVEMNAQNAM